MPSNILNADVGFPEFSEEQNDKEKIDQIVNYLYMLLEQLRYSLYNLDADNFNDKGLEELQLLITEPIYAHLEDDEGRIAELALTAQGLSTDMYDENGKVATIIATANALSESLYDPQTGAITQLQATASGLYAEIYEGDTGNNSRITANANAISTKVSANDVSTAISTFASGLSISVSNNSSNTQSTVKITSNGVQVGSSGTINLSGLVSFTDLSTSGSTTINGSNITTGVISANLITTGSMSANRISTGTLTSNTGTITLQGYLAVKDSNGDSRGYLGGFTSAQGNACVALIGGFTGLGGWVIASSGGAKLGTAGYTAEVYVGTNVTMKDGSSHGLYFSSGALRPDGNNSVSLGNSSNAWTNVYADTGPWSGSDRNEKTDISYDNDTYLEIFDKLQPATYKRIDGTSGRTHFGFIAQDVEEAIHDAGMTTQDYACIAKFEKEDSEGYGYALRYEEFIALAVLKIKKLEARIAALEGE